MVIGGHAGQGTRAVEDEVGHAEIGAKCVDRLKVPGLQLEERRPSSLHFSMKALEERRVELGVPENLALGQQWNGIEFPHGSPNRRRLRNSRQEIIETGCLRLR